MKHSFFIGPYEYEVDHEVAIRVFGLMNIGATNPAYKAVHQAIVGNMASAKLIAQFIADHGNYNTETQTFTINNRRTVSYNGTTG